MNRPTASLIGGFLLLLLLLGCFFFFLISFKRCRFVAKLMTNPCIQKACDFLSRDCVDAVDQKLSSAQFMVRYSQYQSPFILHVKQYINKNSRDFTRKILCRCPHNPMCKNSVKAFMSNILTRYYNLAVTKSSCAVSMSLLSFYAHNQLYPLRVLNVQNTPRKNY